MKKILITLFMCLTLVGLSQPSWAQKFYTCVGENGEKSFSESPCTAVSYQESRERLAREAVNQHALESVKRDIIKVKREILDLDRFYEFNVRSLNGENKKIFSNAYREDRKLLKSKLYALEGKRTQLVDQSFGFVAHAS